MKHVEIFTQNYDKVFTDKTIKKQDNIPETIF